MSRVALLVGFVFCLFGCGAGSELIQTYRLGQKVQTGPLTYSAFETHWFLSLGSGPNARIPANRFMIVRVRVFNSGATYSNIPTFTLVDDRGQSVPELTDGTGVLNWLGVVRKLNPLTSDDGNIVFDVAPQHFKLRVSDEMDQIASYIDLPLNFVSDERSQ